MSRIGKKTILIPAGVNVNLQASQLTIKGPKGSLSMVVPPEFKLSQEGASLALASLAARPDLKAKHGLYRSLIANMVEGVSQGYLKELELQGVGFKAAVQGKQIVFSLGFSSPVTIAIPAGVAVKVSDNVNVSLSGPDKQQVGDLAASIKALYPAEPYKGKGIRYKGEYVRRKVGKTVA